MVLLSVVVLVLFDGDHCVGGGDGNRCVVVVAVGGDFDVVVDGWGPKMAGVQAGSGLQFDCLMFIKMCCWPM